MMAFPAKYSTYNEDDVRCIIPEAIDPVIKISSPHFKKQICYWQITDSSVSRVKASELNDNVLISTEGAKTITGTASENFEPIQTLGTTIIEICANLRVTVHVTPSSSVAPMIVDGILGRDVFAHNWTSTYYREDISAKILENKDSGVVLKAFPARLYVTDYVRKVRDCIGKICAARDDDECASLSKTLHPIRPYLPPEVGGDSRLTVLRILADFKNCFYLPGDDIKPINFFRYPIKTKSHDVINSGQQKLSREEWNMIEVHVRDYLRQGILRPSSSEYNFSVRMDEKKPDSRGIVSHRLVVGYGMLNNCSEKENFPIPGIFDAVDELHGSKYFTVLDLAKASFQIPLEPQDIPKTAFSTLIGRYEFTRMPDAMKNSAEYVQRMMNRIFEGLRDQLFVSHDDILIHAPTMMELELRVRRALTRVSVHGVKLQPGKCQLLRNKVLYLGFLITDKGICPNPKKMKILRGARPANATDLGRFLGLVNTYSRFIKDCAGLVKPLWGIYNEPCFRWTVEAADCYGALQRILAEDLFLAYPDWNATFIVNTGISRHGIWAEVSQRQGRFSCQDIAFASRTFTAAESRLTASEQKKIASIYGQETFRRYVQNNQSLVELTKKLRINK